MGLFDFLKKKNPASVGQESTKEQSQKSDKAVPMSYTMSAGAVLPINERVAGQKPMCDGLYPHEVLVLSYATSYYDKGNQFPQFWWYSYGIDDVQKVLDSLRIKGFIRQGDVMDAIAMEKVSTIKDVLQQHGLKTTGKKLDLVARLHENVSIDELNRIFLKRPYILNQSGNEMLKK